MSKKSKKHTHKTYKKQQKSLFMRFCKWMLVLGVWGGLFLGGTVLWFAKDLPDITKSATFERRTSIVIKASDDTVIARYGESKGHNIDVDELPPYLTQAILATEDRRFYDHPGIDLIGISRAMVTNLIKGRLSQGGSTITQQLAKNLFLTHERKLPRKIKEALLAIWLERELTKKEILSAYMNRVYLGSGTYGFEAAAQLYFGKPAKNVNLREAAILAGLLKAPSKYSPLNNPKLAKERSDVVLAAMVDAGYLKKEDIKSNSAMMSLSNTRPKTEQNARYFADWIVDGLDDIVGTPDMDMIVETTLDSGIQSHAESSLIKTIDNAGEKADVSQGAALIMRPDGAVLGMVGGYNYGQSQFNRVTQALRSPGSSFKPFVYLAALEQGWSPQDTILDAPITEGKYHPQNFGGKFYGTVTLEMALAKSMNTATVRLAQDVGVASVIKTAKNLGILSNMERDLSLSLGSSGISMLEMGTAYAMLSNGGKRVYPYAITRITDNDGRVLYTRKPLKSYKTVINPKNVRDLSLMMQTVINSGTGVRASLPYPASGKTGTSQDNRDAWFAGFTDRLISVVWLGNDDNSPMHNITGGSLPAQIWHDIMIYGNERQSPITLIGTPTEFSNTSRNQSSDGDGFSGLLGRLLSGGSAPENKQKKPYANLNN